MWEGLEVWEIWGRFKNGLNWNNGKHNRNTTSSIVFDFLSLFYSKYVLPPVLGKVDIYKVME